MLPMRASSCYPLRMSNLIGYMTHATIITGRDGGRLVVALADNAQDAQIVADRCLTGQVIRVEELRVEPSVRSADR